MRFLGVVAGIGRQFNRCGCACAQACGCVEPTHAAKARHELAPGKWRYEKDFIRNY